MEIVKCVGVKKVYGEGEAQVEALRGIDLTVESGEFLAVAGASGSGKSTLLHILGSVDKATEGEVLVGGTDIGRLSPREAALYRRRKAGLIYQFYNLIPSMTVERNIQMPLLLDKRKPDPEYFRQIVEMLGLEEKLKAHNIRTCYPFRLDDETICCDLFDRCAYCSREKIGGILDA